MSSKTVDTRVVEMRFDNSQFEKETKTSMRTLEKLKAALNFSGSTKSLDQLNKSAKSTNFDSLLSSVQALEKRFSILGIAGMQMVQNLTNALTGKFVSAFKYVDDAIIQGGKRRAFNLENAHFQLQALLKDEEKVQAVMADANESVTDTAYAYDEAAKAASQFAATGMQSGEEMQRALKGIAGVAAMTNSEYASISQIFTTVAGQGRLMGDQLLQLASRGLNAAATIKEFFNGVNSGAIQASDGVKSAIYNLTNGLEVSEGEIREFVSDGQISFNIFAEAMGNAFGDSAKRANETFNGALSNMKSALGRIGAEFYSPLIAQNSEVVLLINAVKDRINELKKSLTFSEEMGNVNALSKQFTDTVLKMSSSLREWVSNVDIQTPIRVFYHGVESIKNVTKGLLQVVDPVRRAFNVVFGKTLNFDNLEKLSARLEQFTSKLRVSEETSNNLRRAFQGVFNVINLLCTIFVKLLAAIFPITSPIDELGGGLVALAGYVGDLLTKFTLWIQSSPKFEKTFELISKVVKILVSGVTNLVGGVISLTTAFGRLPIVQKSLDKIRDIFSWLGTKFSENLKISIDRLKDFSETLKVIVPVKMHQLMMNLSEAIKTLMRAFNGIDLSTPKRALESFREALLKLWNIFMRNEGFATFVENLKIYMKNLKEAFTLDNLLANIEKFRSVVGGFIMWLRDVFSPVLKELNLGTFIAGGTGVGIVYALVKMSGAFEKVAGAIDKFKSIPDFFTSMKGVMASYQRNLNAGTLIKIAGAIAILSASLVLLSFANPDNLMSSAVALSMVAGVLLLGVTKFMEAYNKTKTLNDALNTLSKGLTRSLNNLAKAIKWRAIAKAFKSFGLAMAIISGSIIALAMMYNKDAESMDKAIELMKKMALAMVGMIAVVSLIGQILPKGMKAMNGASTGILALSLSLGIVVATMSKLFDMEFPEDWKTKIGILAGIILSLSIIQAAMNLIGGGVGGASTILALTVMLYTTVLALSKIFKMEIPDDYENRLAILGEIFAGVALIALAVGAASALSSGKLKAAGTILALAGMLYVTVIALEKLMKMEFSDDYKVRLGVLGGIFIALGALMITIGKASKLTGGSIKAAGTIVAMCLFIATVVGALMVLQMIPGDKLLKGASALGIVLLTLAGALYGAGQITKPGVYKSILAMAVVTGTIVASLAILSIIPFDKLARSAAILGSMLLALALDFAAIGKITNEKSWATVLAMAGTIVLISVCLSELSKIPWDQLLVSAVALGGVLLAMAAAFKVISMSEVDLAKSGLFLLASTSMLLIVISLVSLANLPWAGLLAAGTALSATLLAFSSAFLIISKSNPNPMSIAVFLAASASLLLVAGAIALLANYQWQNLLGAATAISEVLLAMSVAMGVCTLVGKFASSAISGILLLDLFIANLAAVITALGYLFKSEDAQALLNGGINVLITIAEGISKVVDTLVGGTLEKLSARLPAIGTNISTFMTNLDPFIKGSKMIDDTVVNGVSGLAKTLLMLTGVDIVNGIVSFFKGGNSTLSDFGKELAKFAPYLMSFAIAIEPINAKKVEAASSAAQMMSEVTKNLPRTGSIMDKVFGTKYTLSDFGKELAKFGPHLSKFGDSIKDINPSQVEAAANAADMMSKVAKNLPNSGGLAAKIFGDNSLSDFGKELESFGPHIAQFAKDVEGIQPEMVEGAANATSILAKVAKNLPNEGGWIAKIFGENTMSQFGDGLERLGSALNKFYEEVSGVDGAILESSSTQLQRLVDICKGMTDFDSSGMTGFALALETMGQNGINAFVQGFSDSMDRVEKAVNTMLGYVKSSLDRGKGSVVTSGTAIGSGLTGAIQMGIISKQQNVLNETQTLMNAIVEKTRKLLAHQIFNSIGVGSMNGLLQAIQSKQGALTSAAGLNATKIVSEFSNRLTGNKFIQIANSAMNGLVSGIQSKSWNASNAATQVVNTVVNTISRNFTWQHLYPIGANAALGLAYGIESRIYEIANAAIKASNAAINAANNALQVHSPSRIFFWMGEMVDKGLANGILKYIGIVTAASRKMTDEAIDTTEDAFYGISEVAHDILGDDLNPVITPTMDLSGIRRNCNDLSQMMNEAIGNTYIKASSLAPNVISSREQREMESQSILSGLKDFIASTGQPSGDTWNNTWNITGDDPEEIAEEVSQILQRQIKREEAVWG